MPAEQIGRVFSFALIVGLIRSILASYVGERFGTLKPLLISALGVGACFIGVTDARTTLMFSLSMYVFGIMLCLFLPYLISVHEIR